MADTINSILESMIPHLEELQQIGIFEEGEIKGIVKRRRQMEYKLFRRPPKKEDFLKAIDYEKNLDKLRKLRKERLGVVTSQNGEFGISNRIHGLYRRVTKRFKGDINLWLDHIKYARQFNQHGMVGRLYGKVLAIHPAHISLWIMAAKFEFEERQDASAARVLFQEGLRTNSNSQKLWHEYYRMELMAVDKLRKRKNVLALNLDETLPHDDVMDYGISTVVYNEAIKAIPNDINFRLGFVQILKLFEDTQEKEQEIFDNLLSDFPHSALRLDAVAKRSWFRVNDHHVSHRLQELENVTERLYIEGITYLSTCTDRAVINEELILWEKYIHWIIERLQYWSERQLTDSMFSNPSKLLDTCDNCATKERMTEPLAIDIIEVLQCNGLHKSIDKLVSQMIAIYPSSYELWTYKLNCECFNGVFLSDLVSLCKRAISSVKSVEFSVKFWLFLLNQSILRQSESSFIDSLFKECLENTCNNETILLMYLDWLYVNKGIEHIRIFHKSYWLATDRIVKKRTPFQGYPSVSVYLKIINHELSEENVNESKIVNLFEEAIYHHGSTSTELWLSYISTLIGLGTESMKGVSNIYWRAVRTLDGSLTNTFMSKHSILIG